MAESTSTTKNIKQLIRSGGFSKRLNLSRPRPPTPSLSTINSAGSEEEDGDSTDIDDTPEEKRISKAEKKAAKVKSKDVKPNSPEIPQEESLAQRAIRAGVPMLIQNMGNRRSNASSTSNRSSRTSIASSRSSTVSTTAAGLPTIKEIPQSPDMVQDRGSIITTSEAPSTPQPQDDTIVPIIAPPPGFQPIRGTVYTDTNSAGSTLVYQSPPRADGLMINRSSMTPPLPQYQPPKGPPQVHSYHLSSESGSEKSGPKSSGYTPSVASSNTYNSTSASPPAYQGPFDEASQPGSRFSWHQNRSDKAKSVWTRWFVEWWGLEIVSLVFSGICMIIIMSVLAKYDGKELPQWKVGITINAFISILSGFAKSALLLPCAEALGQLKWNWFSKKPRKMMDFEVLDSASRGPWGSFVLLTRTKGITLASIGAAVILLSLPLDLFFQQIVQYPKVWVNTGNSTVSRSVIYNPEPERYTYQGAESIGADLSMISTVTPLFFQTGIPFKANVDCPSNKCTWEPFETLGICGTCKPSPDLLKFGCFSALADWQRDNGTSPGNGSFPLDVGNSTSCGWYLMPDGMDPILMTGYATDGPSGKPLELLGGRMAPLRDLWTRQPLYPGGTLGFPEVKNPIQDWVTAFVPGGGAGAYLNSTPVVHECAVHWCLQTIQSEVQGEKLSEVVTATRQLDTDFVDEPWADFRTYLPSFNLTVPDLHGVNGTTSTYHVGNITARTVLQSIELFVPSSWTATSATADLFAKAGWRDPTWKIVTEKANPWLGSDPIKHVEALALAMSTTLRRTPHGDTGTFDQVTGKIWEQRTQVHIRWAYIVLPALLLIISFIFLIFTMARSSREDRIGIWKTSALAVLFNGLGDDVQNMMGGEGPQKMGQARTTAKNLTVHLGE